MVDQRVLVMLATLVCVSAAPAAKATDDWCPSGEFETDSTQINSSFRKPDVTLPKQNPLRHFAEEPAEIARIRSGVIWTYINTGPFGPPFENWTAYDAERHLFVLVDGGESSLVDSGRSKCEGYRFKIRAGEASHCTTIVAGTPDQARQFACRLNRLAVDAARAVSEYVRQAAEEKKLHDLEWARIVAEATAEAAAMPKQPGAIPEVLVLGQRPHQLLLSPSIVEGPIKVGTLMKDGTRRSFERDAVLEDWVLARLGSSDPRLWRAAPPSHVQDIVVDKQGTLFLLVAGYPWPQGSIIALTTDGRFQAVYPQPTPAHKGTFYLSHIAIDDGGLMLSGGSRPQVFRLLGTSATRFAADILTSLERSSIAELDSPGSFDGLAPDPDGSLYLTLQSEIFKRTPDGQLTRLAGSETPGQADGSGSAASFSPELHIAVLPGRALVVADTGNNIIRRVSSDGLVTTIAGKPGTRGSSDGSGTRARFNEPTGIAVDINGFIYVADTGNHALRKIDPEGRVRTLARRSIGGGSSGAWVDGPTLVAVDAAGTVYFSNGVDNNISKMFADGRVMTLDVQQFVDRIILEVP